MSTFACCCRHLIKAPASIPHLAILRTHQLKTLVVTGATAVVTDMLPGQLDQSVSLVVSQFSACVL